MSGRDARAKRIRKGVYRDLREGTLGETLDYETGSYDGVVSAGVLTAGHAPATSLDELVRDDTARRARHLHASLRSGTARIRRQDRRARAARAGGSSSSGATSFRRSRTASRRCSSASGRSACSSRGLPRSSCRVRAVPPSRRGCSRAPRRSRLASPWKFVTTQHDGVVVDRVREAEALVDDRAEAGQRDSGRARQCARRQHAAREGRVALVGEELGRRPRRARACDAVRADAGPRRVPPCSAASVVTMALRLRREGALRPCALASRPRAQRPHERDALVGDAIASPRFVRAGSASCRPTRTSTPSRP